MAELPKPLATLHWRPFDDSKGPRLFQVVDSIAWHQSPKTERGSVRVYSEEQVLELLRAHGVPVVAAANPGLDQGPCAICGKRWPAARDRARNLLATLTDGVLESHPPGPMPEDSYPDQTILHSEREAGNCLQATIAGVLGWPLAAVPHFALLGEDHWWDCLQAWLDSQGYWIDYQPTSYAKEGGELLPRCWLSGTSPRGFSHAVIGDSATLQMLHDPHPSRAGLTEHSYTIYFFRKPAAGVGIPQPGQEKP